MPSEKLLSIAVMLGLCLPAFASSPMPVGAVPPPVQKTGPYTPNPGTPEREAICDALRNHLGRENRFTVHHLKVMDGPRFRYAFFRGVEMVPTGGGKTKYADSQILALVYLDKAAGVSSVGGRTETMWYVAELARLNDADGFAAFQKNVRARIAEDGVPPDILDPGFID